MAYRGNNHKGGRPRGRKNSATLEKETILKAYQQRVMKSTNRLLDYQFSAARGATYLFKIEKECIIGPKGGKTYRSKKAELVTSVTEIQDYLEGMINSADMEDDQDPGATYYFMTTKDPDTGAIKDMFDRTYGKSPQGIHLQDAEGKSLPITQINLIPVKMK